MDRLRSREIDTLVDLAGALGDLTAVGELLPILQHAVPSDLASYTELGATVDDLVIIADPVDSLREDVLEAFATHSHQNPLIARHAADPDDGATRMSDHLSDRALRATDLYGDVYRHLEIRYQAAITVPTPGRVAGLTASRGARDFSDGEVRVLRAARPFVRAALANLAARRRLDAMLAGLAEVSAAPAALLLLTAPARLAAADDRSERWLRRAAPVIEALRAWAAAPAGPLEFELAGTPYIARYVAAAAQHAAVVVVEAARREPQPADFAALGLTRRQGEVLARVRDGATNEQIATALWLSPRTVAHHVEHILVRLGVPTRTAAAHRLEQQLAAPA